MKVVPAALMILASLSSVTGGLRGWIVEKMIFQPSRSVDYTPERLGMKAEELFLEAEDGTKIHAYYVPAQPGPRRTEAFSSPGDPRAILFLHGNAGNASHRLPNAWLLAALRADVLLIDYRGYGLSEGDPSEAGVYADARAGLDHLVQERAFPLDRIVVFGRSLGSVVAVNLAVDRPLGGLILESAFPSASAAAKSIFGSFGSWFARGRFDSRDKIQRIRSPLLSIHGDVDEIIPFDLGVELFELAPEPKAFYRIEDAGHNNTVQVGGEAYLRRIGAFLNDVVPDMRSPVTEGDEAALPHGERDAEQEPS